MRDPRAPPLCETSDAAATRLQFPPNDVTVKLKQQAWAWDQTRLAVVVAAAESTTAQP
jgi:hypothetical protein